jgi:hypothetical protein
LQVGFWFLNNTYSVQNPEAKILSKLFFLVYL